MADTPDPQLAARRQEVMDRMTAARQQGLSWEAINQALSNRVEAARKAGISDAAIQQSLGFSSPQELIEATQTEAQQHLAATKPTSWLGAFWNGMTHSSTAALLGIKPEQTPPMSHGRQLTAGLGETVGDIPAMIAGGVGGAVTGAVLGTPEGGPVGTVTGGYLGAAGGTTALPQLIKSERDRYATALANGQVKGPADYLRIQGQVLQDTVNAAAAGVTTAGAGKVVSPLLDKMGASKVTKFLGTAGTEAATMATTQAALAGHMPTMEDLVDAAVTIGAFHVAHAIAAPQYRAIRTRLMQNYVDTGEMPQAAAQRAVSDPVFRAQMLGNPEPKTPAGSSRTYAAMHNPSQRGVISGPHSPLPPDTYVVPRAAGDFDHALAWMFKEEGGLTTDTGGVTKYGISAKAHPGLDIAHISKDDAAEIYHREYWRAIDADALPPNMRLAAFDSAVNQGVGQTKTWLAEAGGDLQKFMQLRVEGYAKLARDPKYAKYAGAWARRLKDLGAPDAMAGIVERGPDNVGRDFSEDDRKTLALDEEGGGGGEKPPGGGEPPSFEPGDEGSLERVMSRVAPTEEPDRWGNTLKGLENIYGELFDGSHPVRKLVDAVRKGDSIDDFRNPEILGSLTANSGEVSKRSISNNMVDLDGNITGPGLLPIVEGKTVGQKFSIKEQNEFLEGYARSKFAIMMEEQGKKTGIDVADARKVVADLGPKYEKSFQQLADWRNQSLRNVSNVHGKDKVEKLISDNSAPMPGYRRMDDGSIKSASTGKPGIWNPIKTAKGSERQFEPMLKSLMQDEFIRRQIGMNDRTVNAVADLGLKGNEATERRLVDFNVMGAIDDLKEKGIDDEDILNSLVKAAGASIKPDEIPRFKDGKLFAVKFDDPELTKMLRGYDMPAMKTAVKVLRVITTVPRNMQTRLNPFFPIRNLLYDLPWQHSFNPDSLTPFLNPLASLYTGLGHMTGNSELYQRWQNSGGADHIFTKVSSSDYIKDVLRGHEELSLADNVWNAATGPYKVLSAWTRMLSQPMRVGRFVRGIEAGESPERAAAASVESAFHPPSYGGPLGKAWNQIVPYTTAHLRGLDIATRAHIGQWGPALANAVAKFIGSDREFTNRTPLGTSYSASRTVSRALVMFTIPVIAQWFAYKDEEWYKAQPEWAKNNVWFWVPPIGGLPAIPIPAPPVASFFYAALPRMMMEKFYDDNPHAFDGFWTAMGVSLLPPEHLLGASILTPIIEHIANYSFHKGAPLVNPDTVRGVQPAEQFTPYSSQAAKDLAQSTSDLPLLHKLSPIVIDNYINQWGALWGRALAAGGDTLFGSAPTNPPVEQKVSDWPGVSSWAIRYPTANAAPIQQFYDTMTKLDQEHGSLLKEIREGNFAAFKRIVDQGGPTAAAYHRLSLGENVPPGVHLGPYYDYMTQASTGADWKDVTLIRQSANALKAGREYSWRVYEDQNKTPHDKRQLLDMANSQMQVISERGNEAMDRALIGVSRPGRSARAPVPDSISFAPPETVQ